MGLKAGIMSSEENLERTRGISVQMLVSYRSDFSFPFESVSFLPKLPFHSTKTGNKSHNRPHLPFVQLLQRIIMEIPQVGSSIKEDSNSTEEKKRRAT